MLRFRFTDAGDIILGRVPLPSGETVAAPLPPPLKPAPPAPTPVGVVTTEGDVVLGQRATAMVSQLGETILAPITRAITLTLAPPPPSPPRQPVEAQTGVAADSWFFVSKLNEFPGNFPPIDTLKSIGITGIALEVDDRLLASGADEARANGFRVAVWGRLFNFNNNVPQYIAAMDQGAQTAKADAIILDVETEAKGPVGSDAYNLNAQVAKAARETFTVQWAVSPIRSDRNDFDFSTYVENGGTVIIETYGPDPLTDLFDPVEVVQLALAAGVKLSQISVLLSPVQATADNLARLKALGVTSVSLYRQDGLEVAASNAASFPGNAPPTEPPGPTSPLAPPPANASVETPTTADEEAQAALEAAGLEVSADAPELDRTLVSAEDVNDYDWNEDESVVLDEPSYTDDDAPPLDDLPTVEQASGTVRVALYE